MLTDSTIERAPIGCCRSCRQPIYESFSEHERKNVGCSRNRFPVQVMDKASDPYRAFLEAKATVAQAAGFEIDPSEINPILKPHQRASVQWAVRGGRRALFQSFGLGKTVEQIEIVRLTRARAGGRGLIVLPLGVRQEFMRDAGMLGVKLQFIRRIEEADDSNGIYLTNYETIRDGKMDPAHFTVSSLDEASCLRSFGSKTFGEIIFGPMSRIPYRFVATATPSPNEYLELLAYAAYLGIMDLGQSKTRFFKRDSTKADHLTLHAHKEDEFWMWIASWALFLQKPSDLGYDDTGYSLPEMKVTWHEIPSDHSAPVQVRSGQQGRLYRNSAYGVTDAAREKRVSLAARIAKMMELRAEDPGAHRIIWHDLEAERHAIQKAIPGAVAVYGSQDLEDREEAIIRFSDGEFQELSVKPSVAGSGCNFQRHCSWAIFLGIGFKFNDLIQAIHRILRYLQEKPVRIDLIYTEAERPIKHILEEKWKRHKAQVERMSGIIREYGLAEAAIAHALHRSIGVKRAEASGESYRLINADAVEESRSLEAAGIDLIITSIPFCYDEQTEILTGRGWISFGDLRCEDRVATVDRDRLCFEWQRPTRIVWERYAGEMLRFQNRCFDLLVTPNHRLFAARRGKGFGPSKLRLIEAEEIARDYERSKRRSGRDGRLLRGWRTCLIPPTTGDGSRPSRITIPPLPDAIRGGHGVELYWIEPEDFMRLAGWYLSEGHADSFTKGRSAGRLSIAQVTNDAFRREIADLFVRIGLPPSMHSRQITIWCRNLAHFLIAEFGSGSKNKRIPAWVRECHPDLLRILRGTMMKGDGARNGTSYTSYSRELRDHFQEVCLKTGWRAAINGNQVYVGDKQVYPEIRGAPGRHTYSGMIGCATVPNGTLIVRRNGKPCVSGNSTQYEYSPSFNDFGHSDNNEHFWRQMDFLTPELFRVLRPGRVCAIHCKDRVTPGAMTGLGFQVVQPFHAEAIFHYQKHGFAFLGMKTIVTDVVRENNHTYRLGWTEQCKDGSRMGAGLPEYILLFRKPPTDNSSGYADVPVEKTKVKYTRSRWQIDAHGFARSNGNRLLAPEDLVGKPLRLVYRAFRNFSFSTVYDFDRHVALGEALDKVKQLRTDFMVLPPQSWHPDVWTDVARMRTLNMMQKRRGQQLHLCPLPFDIVNRLIVQLSMEGETVFDPFMGIGTLPFCAVKLKRKGIGIELNPQYFRDAVGYVEAQSRKAAIPTLYDLMKVEEGDEEIPG